MTSRNYGIQSRRPIPWGHSGDRPPAYDAISRAGSHHSQHLPEDKELAAWAFALLFAGPLLVGSIVLFYLAS